MTTDNTCKECNDSGKVVGNGLTFDQSPPCPSCQPPTQEKDKLDTLDGCDRGPLLNGIHCQICESALRTFIRQEKAASRLEGELAARNQLRPMLLEQHQIGYSKAIEEAKEAVKLYCPKQQNHSAFEKGFDSCKRIVLFVLDKLKKKV